jgi:hypothetical protein
MAGTWATVEQPILETIARLAEDPPGTSEVVEATSLPEGKVQLALRRLYQADYLTGVDASTFDSGFELMRIELLERGLRATGEWPADAYDEFVAAVGQAIESESNPVERTKLEKLRDAATAVGRDVATALITDVLKRATGL